MISVNPDDREALRFLWVKNPFCSEPEVVTLISASPFLLNATIKHHIEEYEESHPEVVRALAQSMYVDDVVCGADRLYARSKEILSHGSF